MLLRLPVFRKSPYISSLISWGSNRVDQGVEMRQGRGCKSFILEVQMSGNGEDREGRKPVQGVLTSRLQQRAPGAQFCWGHLGDGTEHAAQVAHPGALFSISFLHWLRAAPGTIRSKLHLGQGMTKPAVRGRWDLAGAWLQLLGRMGNGMGKVAHGQRPSWQRGQAIFIPRIAVRVCRQTSRCVVPSPLENDYASFPKDGRACTLLEKAVASIYREAATTMTPFYKSGN